METIPLDQALPLAALAKHVPALQAGASEHVAPSTLWRWATRGIRGHRLATIRVGGVTCSSVAALNALLAAINTRPVVAPPSNSNLAAKKKQQQKRIAAAKRRVDAMLR